MSQRLIPEMDEVVRSAARVFHGAPAFLRRQRDVWSAFWEGVRDGKGEDSPREGASEKEAR